MGVWRFVVHDVKTAQHPKLGGVYHQDWVVGALVWAGGGCHDCL